MGESKRKALANQMFKDMLNTPAPNDETPQQQEIEMASTNEKLKSAMDKVVTCMSYSRQRSGRHRIFGTRKRKARVKRLTNVDIATVFCAIPNTCSMLSVPHMKRGMMIKGRRLDN